MMPSSSFIQSLIILIFLQYFTSKPAKCWSNETDVLALLSFKKDVIDQRGALNSWTTNPTQLNYYCSWKGISCGIKHPSRVVSIDLHSQGLMGPLSPHIGNISFLRRINLQNNSFHGPIPQQLGLLRRLVYIEISNNSFSGDIPRNLSQCQNLDYLNLIDNELTGIIPPELASLSKLEHLGLSANTFSGTIPPFLANLTSLIQLSLGDCGLYGEIPDSLARLKKLQRLVLDTNELIGTIPSGLFNISTMRYFVAYSNKLQGNIPSDIGLTLPNLRYLGFGDNNLTGALPISLSNASFLQAIELYSNRFTGPMPTNLDRLTDLEYFSIFSTFVEDDISFIISSLTNCTNLIALQIRNNSLTGSLPLSITNLTTGLRALSIGMNQIHGTIPSGIGNLVGLELLNLYLNLLSGPIPETIGKLTELRQLNLGANRFIDELPSSIGNLTLLSHLYARRNYFSGTIPPSLINCSSLLGMDLSINNLVGPIPREIMSISSLSIFLNLSSNSLSGSVPSEIGYLRNLAALDLSNNRLSGIFPITISSCISLQWLHMENNSFNGEIPQGLSSLSGLQELYLSTNNFSGPIPSFLGRMDLKVLSLSSNRLQGPVPIDGIFQNKSAISLQGNTELCGGIRELDLPPCPSTSNPHKKSPSIVLKILIPIAVFVAIFMIALVLCCYILVRRRTNSRKNLNASSIDQSQFKRLSYADLLRATSGFSEANLIGSGRFSNVYKGILDDGETLIAVKVLKLDVRGAHKSFMSECNALRGARHRNLLKILSISVSTDFQRNDFMALIYPLKPNGSLDKWLHSDQSYITLMQRINIAIDIASAVEYLHNGTGSVIVHGDLKPSNVLLDDDMSAHVGDFGLAKVISNISSSFAADESSSIAVKGTIGYIAPEYGMGGSISTQGDEYSYGILLLEMLTNIRPTSERLSHWNLRDYVANGLSERLIEIFDPLIVGKEGERLNIDVVECVGSVFEIGMACSRQVANDRMSITDAVIQLKRIRAACNAQGFN